MPSTTYVTTLDSPSLSPEWTVHEPLSASFRKPSALAHRSAEASAGGQGEHSNDGPPTLPPPGHVLSVPSSAHSFLVLAIVIKHTKFYIRMNK